MKIQGRDELPAAIAAMFECYPDWRLGQLVSNAAGWADLDLWDIEDEQLLESARSHLQHANSSPATPCGRTERCI